jgi:hypothetical protein
MEFLLELNEWDLDFLNEQWVIPEFIMDLEQWEIS